MVVVWWGQIQDNGRLTVRRTQIDLHGTSATIGTSDTITATSGQDPAWTTAGTSAAVI